MDDEFAREVLRLAEGQSLADFDQGLRTEAQELQVDTSVLEDKDSNKTSTFDASTQPRRRSISTGSQKSQCTDVTDTSHLSRDQSQSSTRPVRGRRSSVRSVSVQDYDTIVNHARFDLRRSSFNFATSPVVSPSPSIFSLSSMWSRPRDSSPKRHIISRGLSRLRLRRTDSGDSTREKE
jgi:hypothetical protein